MRSIVVALGLVLGATACGAGSVAFVTNKDATGAPIPQEISIAPGGTATAKVQLLAKGAEVEPYTITVSSQDPSQVTATVSPTTADVKDGVPFDISVTATADAAATAGMVPITVDAKATQEAAVEIDVNVTP